jgi:hypothetical protein
MASRFGPAKPREEWIREYAKAIDVTLSEKEG